jgi:hypothetical protein
LLTTARLRSYKPLYRETARIEDMKTFALSSLLLLVVSSPAFAQKIESDSLRTPRNRIDKKVQREILKMEAIFGRAIERRDAASLNRLLADYYADGNEGGERAMAKKATLAHCKAGTLPYYRIQAERKFNARSEVIEVEGISKRKQTLVTDNNPPELIRVRRMWTKKDGNWLLIAQTIGPVQPDAEK